MKYLVSLLLIFGFGLSGFGQTIKSLGYNTTNGQVIANTGTNGMTFTNANITFNNISLGGDGNNGTITSPASSAVIDFVNYELYGGWVFTDTNGVSFAGPLLFSGVTNAAVTRANLGFSTNLNTLWTSTNASDARIAVGLGSTNVPTFRRVVVDPQASGALGVQYGANDSGLYNGANYNQLSLRVGGVNALTAEINGVSFANPAATRTNLGLGGGITTNRTFVSYNGTNYTTNTVTISNGIVTGWTQ